TRRLLENTRNCTCGWRDKNTGSSGASRLCASDTGQLRRTSPLGSPRSAATSSVAARASASIAWQWRYKRSPASVTTNLRVVRCSRRTPSPSSSCDTRLLKRDLGTLSARLAAEKPPCSTTAAKKYKSLRSGNAPASADTAFAMMNTPFELRHLIEGACSAYCLQVTASCGSHGEAHETPAHRFKRTW